MRNCGSNRSSAGGLIGGSQRFGATFAATLVSALLSNSIARCADRPGDTRPPNILLILVDDLGKEWISCYGAEGIETPRIDALAAGGMRFENAWCMPQCTPTRVTLLTGQYPWRHGWTNHWDVPRWGSGCHFDPQHNRSFARILRQAGYATAIAGKWQIDDFRVEPEALREAGFDQWCVWTGGEGGNPPSNRRYWQPYIFQRKQSGTRRGAFGPDVYCQFLIDFLRDNRHRPMLLYYPMTLTHGPLVKTPDEPEAESKIDRHKAMVRYTDKLVGRLVDALEQVQRDSIVIFTTDNGTSGGITGRRYHRSVRGAKSKMVEAGTAVPFIVYGPGRVPAGKVTGELTDLTDMAPTLAELAGVAIEDDQPVDGRSIAPLILGKRNRSPRQWIFAQGGHPAIFRDGRVVPARPYDDRVIRNRRYKLWIGHDRQPTALYDLQEDPWEEENLLDSDDPQVVAARRELMAVIDQQPQRDAAPGYDPNPPQSWDRFPKKKNDDDK